jgi:hypothetical protein
MRIATILFALLITGIVSAQTFQGNNTYVVISDKEDTSVYFLTKTQAIVTNANATGNSAFEIDSVKIFDAVDEYGIKFPELPSKGEVKRGEVYTHKGEVVRIIQDHNRSTVSHYDPKDVPALYLFRPVSGCPEWKQPSGAHDAYNIGDCCTYKGSKYESVINANVWSPDIYPAGWKKL